MGRRHPQNARVDGRRVNVADGQLPLGGPDERAAGHGELHVLRNNERLGSQPVKEVGERSRERQVGVQPDHLVTALVEQGEQYVRFAVPGGCAGQALVDQGDLRKPWSHVRNSAVAPGRKRVSGTAGHCARRLNNAKRRLVSSARSSAMHRVNMGNHALSAEAVDGSPFAS